MLVCCDSRKYEEPSSPKVMLMHETDPLFGVVFHNLHKMKIHREIE